MGGDGDVAPAAVCDETNTATFNEDACEEFMKLAVCETTNELYNEEACDAVTEHDRLCKADSEDFNEDECAAFEEEVIEALSEEGDDADEGDDATEGDDDTAERFMFGFDEDDAPAVCKEGDAA